jgi:hypothetical protein
MPSVTCFSTPRKTIEPSGAVSTFSAPSSVFVRVLKVTRGFAFASDISLAPGPVGAEARSLPYAAVGVASSTR